MKRIGPTGVKAEDPIDETDKGGLLAAVGIQDDKIRIEFGAAVRWLALGRAEAIDLAVMLLKFAEDLEEEEKKLQ